MEHDFEWYRVVGTFRENHNFKEIKEIPWTSWTLKPKVRRDRKGQEKWKQLKKHADLKHCPHADCSVGLGSKPELSSSWVVCPKLPRTTTGQLVETWRMKNVEPPYVLRTLGANMCGIPAHSIGIEIHCKCVSICGHELYEFTNVSGVQQSSSSKVKRMPQSLASTLQLCIDCWLFCLDALLPK
jgi:hypothetical protein